MDSHDQEQAVASAAGHGPRDTIELDEKEEIYTRALCRTRIRFALYLHVTLFVFVIILLSAINLLTTPQHLWVQWPFFGWGFALILHWFLGIRLLKFYDNIKAEEIARQLENRGQ